MTIESTEAAPRPVTEQGAQLTLDDLKVMLQVVQVASQRGSFKPEEFVVVGALYDKLYKFLDSAGALTPSPAPVEPTVESPVKEATPQAKPVKKAKGK